MGLIVKKKSGKEGLIGIWELDDSEFDHPKSKSLSTGDEKILSTFHFPQKRQQWLAVRILLEELTENHPSGISWTKIFAENPSPTKKDLNIIYDAFSKPSIADSSLNISISHSTNKVAIILEPSHSTGIDIEIMRAKVERIATKFMSEKEMDSLSEKNRIEQLYVYWCAKESLYKYYGKKEVLFKEHLFIDAFEYKGQGELTGTILKNDQETKLSLRYEKIDDHMLVYISYV